MLPCSAWEHNLAIIHAMGSHAEHGNQTLELYRYSRTLFRYALAIYDKTPRKNIPDLTEVQGFGSVIYKGLDV